MLYTEFTKRTNFYPTQKQFDNVIHPNYMASNMDKDTFCRQWVKKELAACSKTNAAQIEDLERKNRQLTDLIKGLTSHTDRPVDFNKLYRELIKINGHY